ncbi:MAG TPA: hypothetical protein VGZ90_19195 [Puia sp.]|jgi:hypothetical protein|nr:hypothetical protein [Puia sp.]
MKVKLLLLLAVLIISFTDWHYDLSDFKSSFFGAGIRMAPPRGILTNGLRILVLRYGHYTQTTNLNSDIISLNLVFK